MTSTRSSRLETENEHKRRVLEDAVITLASRDNFQRQGQTAFDKVLQVRPPSYNGTTDPVILEGWIRTMEKVFRATRCLEEEKLDIGTYYLEGEVDNWWTMLHPQCTADSNFRWPQFLENWGKDSILPHWGGVNRKNSWTCPRGAWPFRSILINLLSYLGLPLMPAQPKLRRFYGTSTVWTQESRFRWWVRSLQRSKRRMT